MKIRSKKWVKAVVSVVDYVCLSMDRECVEILMKSLLNTYREKLYEYNNTVKKYGFYLKPFHVVAKRVGNSVRVYSYYGRYWYSIQKHGSKIKWVYVGLKKPLDSLPDPPLNPITLFKIREGVDKELSICIETPNISTLTAVLTSIGAEDGCIDRVLKLLREPQEISCRSNLVN